MTTPSPNNDPQQQLAAFADGELDGEQNLEVLKQVQQDPAMAEQVAGQQKLRQAVAKAMDGPAYKAPDELRDKIAQLAQTEPAGDSGPPADHTAESGSPVLAVIGRWVPAAVAAVLLIGALVIFNINGNNGSRSYTGIANIFSASMVEQFGDRHYKCSRKLEPIHGVEQFPQDLTQLPGALSEYFSQPIDPDVLNLSALGYEFDVAGLCILPGNGSIHILYKSQGADGQDETLSLWMRPSEEGSGIEPDRLYATQATEATHPMVVWRHGNMVYYLVGDSYDTVQRAFDGIRTNLD